MRDPIANSSKEAIKLRTAAMNWAYYREEPADDEDTKGQRLNRALLKAAIAYAKRTENE